MKALIILLLLPMLAQAATVTLDGKVIDAERVEITTRSAPAPEPPAPAPAPEPPQTGCATHAPVIDWASPGGRRTLSVGRDGAVYAFTATDNPSYGGYINVMEVAGQEGVTRRVGISRCPGEPLPDNRCSRQGTGLISVPWLQRPYSGACSLTLGQRYYLEVRNVTGCSGSCGAYLAIPTNGRP